MRGEGGVLRGPVRFGFKRRGCLCVTGRAPLNRAQPQNTTPTPPQHNAATLRAYRVGVEQDDAVPLLAQRLARLRARVVKLARLADHDGAGADDHDRVEVLALLDLFVFGFWFWFWCLLRVVV